ncbi:MAG: pyridoxine 5'-phosphate synthase [Burkholderiaceae bacterium]
MTTELSVNLNKVALLRNSRTLGIPNLAKLGQIALEAGAAGLTVHPRPDERHIRPGDVTALARLLTAWPSCEFNIEGNPFHGLLDHVEAVRPAQATFVPDESSAFTSDHGWDLVRDGEAIRPLIARAKAAGARVSLFMDPEPSAMALARELGADRVELYTEPYARAFGTADQAASLAQYRAAAQAALAVGLGVNAGHDLNLDNLGPFLAEVPGVAEVSIGHALIADALEFGLADTVGRYVAVIRRTEGELRHEQRGLPRGVKPPVQQGGAQG